MRWDWDRIFDHFLDDFWTPTEAGAQGVPLEVFETDETFLVRAEIPGVAPEDIEIELTGGVLSISGQKTDGQETEEGRRHYSERSFGAFQRSLKLPYPVDSEQVTAEHRNGVLTVTLQKAEAVRSKRIEVQSS